MEATVPVLPDGTGFSWAEDGSDPAVGAALRAFDEAVLAARAQYTATVARAIGAESDLEKVREGRRFIDAAALHLSTERAIVEFAGNVYEALGLRSALGPPRNLRDCVHVLDAARGMARALDNSGLAAVAHAEAANALRTETAPASLLAWAKTQVARHPVASDTAPMLTEGPEPVLLGDLRKWVALNS